jgi:hypothetical protein
VLRVDVRMTAFGASYPLALVPAKVSCPNRQLSLGSGRGNASSCPKADTASSDFARCVTEDECAFFAVRKGYLASAAHR